jgi:hypothetical protein
MAALPAIGTRLNVRRYSNVWLSLVTDDAQTMTGLIRCFRCTTNLIAFTQTCAMITGICESEEHQVRIGAGNSQ